jgi:hypothetical protein
MVYVIGFPRARTNADWHEGLATDAGANVVGRKHKVIPLT